MSSRAARLVESTSIKRGFVRRWRPLREIRYFAPEQIRSGLSPPTPPPRKIKLYSKWNSSLRTCSCERSRTISECLHGRFMIWGRTRPGGGWQERGLFVWLPSCCGSLLAEARAPMAQNWGPELAHPVLRSCPRTGPSPNRDAANWKQMVPGRLGLQA